MTQDYQYEYLEDVIDLEEYVSLPTNYHWFEDVVIRPKLETAGYYGINFHPTETNMFGPNTRVVTCLDPAGKFCSFIYN